LLNDIAFLILIIQSKTIAVIWMFLLRTAICPYFVYWVIFTRSHHGLPDFPQLSWINSPSEWDYIQYLCPLYPTEHGGWVDPPVDCECLAVKPQDRPEVFNRVFSFTNQDGVVIWVNVHGDENFFRPENPKEVPTLKMLSGYTVRQQLICMLNRQRRASYIIRNFKPFKNISMKHMAFFMSLVFGFSQALTSQPLG